MNIFSKLFGVPYYPTKFQGYTIDYNYVKDRCRYCGNTAYGAYVNKADIGISVTCLYYCPHCQKIFGIPQKSSPILVCR